MDLTTATVRKSLSDITFRTLLPYGTGIIFAVSLLAIIWVMPTDRIANRFRSWSELEGPGPVFSYVCTYVVFTIGSLPVWPLPFLAGSLFGPFWGTIWASASCVAGAAINFGIARTIRRTALKNYFSQSLHLAALEKTMKAGSWKLIAAIRVSHFMTFGIQNYILGLTEVHFWIYLLTTWAVTLPGITLQVYLGYLGFSSMEAWRNRAADPWEVWLLRIGSLIVLAAAISYLGYLFRKKYLKEVQERLEKELHTEAAKNNDGSFRWSTLLLLLLNVGMISLAVWAVLANR